MQSFVSDAVLLFSYHFFLVFTYTLSDLQYKNKTKANSKTASNNDVRVLSKQKCIVDICTLLVITIVTFFVFTLGYDDEDDYVPAGTSAY